MQQSRISYIHEHISIFFGDMKTGVFLFHKSTRAKAIYTQHGIPRGCLFNAILFNTIFRVVPCACHRSVNVISPWEDATALPATQYPDYLVVYSALDQIYRSALHNRSANYPIAAVWNHGFMIKMVTKSGHSAVRYANNPPVHPVNPIGSNWRLKTTGYQTKHYETKYYTCSTI